MKIEKNNYQNIKFNGELKFISKGTERIRREIINNDIIQELLNGEKDLYINIRARKATKQELLMDKDNELYKVIFTYKKTAKTFFAKLLGLFTTKRQSLSKSYHSEDGTLAILQERAEKIKEKLR